MQIVWEEAFLSAAIVWSKGRSLMGLRMTVTLQQSGCQTREEDVFCVIKGEEFGFVGGKLVGMRWRMGARNREGRGRG